MIATIANGGELLAPRLIEGIYTGGELEEEVSFSPNRVISEKMADLLCGFMETVVIEGSGQAGPDLKRAGQVARPLPPKRVYTMKTRRKLSMRGSAGFTRLRILSLPL